MRKQGLTTKESLALQAIVQRVGMAEVLDNLFMLSQELVAEVTAESEELGAALYEALESARKAELALDAYT